MVRFVLLALALALLTHDASASTEGGTPAERALEHANARLDAATTPARHAEALVSVAVAHTARARESGDARHYDRALAALALAREADPDRADLRKTEAWVRLGRHEFRVAERLARTHVAAHPADHEAWGLLGDAAMELGELDTAAGAYQRMMDLRPGPGAYARAAYYRERTGDPAGALALIDRALFATGRRELEQRAWLLVLSAALEEDLGRPERARHRLERALELFPDYHAGLSALAAHHVARGRPAEALPLARRALELAPHAERWLTLADALRGVGREEEARAAESRFEREALAHVDAPDNENLFLIDFYLDRRSDPDRALALAEREAVRRPRRTILERLERARAAVAAHAPASANGPDALDEPHPPSA